MLKGKIKVKMCLRKRKSALILEVQISNKNNKNDSMCRLLTIKCSPQRNILKANEASVYSK